MVVASLCLLPSSGTASARPTGSKLVVVAAENFWGSIAAQLGGNRVTVSSIIVNPDTDPHDYDPEASDARAMASSQLAIVNGIGYDNWASQLLAANPSSSRVVVDVGKLLGLKSGDNPHQWYSPSSVQRVVTAIVAGLEQADPGRSFLLLGAADAVRNDVAGPLRRAPNARSEGVSRALPSATAKASSRRSAAAWACGSSRRTASRRRSPKAQT